MVDSEEKDKFDLGVKGYIYGHAERFKVDSKSARS